MIFALPYWRWRLRRLPRALWRAILHLLWRVRLADRDLLCRCGCTRQYLLDAPVPEPRIISIEPRTNASVRLVAEMLAPRPDEITCTCCGCVERHHAYEGCYGAACKLEGRCEGFRDGGASLLRKQSCP